MNERIDLTSNGDFIKPLKLTAYHKQFFHNLQNCYYDNYSYKYVNGDNRPWTRVTYEDSVGDYCDRCGTKLTNDLPWYRRYCLCKSCREALAKECYDIDIDLQVPWRRSTLNMPGDGYMRVFMSEFMDGRRASG